MVDKRRKKVNCLGKGGAVVLEEARAKMVMPLARSGRARSMREIFFLGQGWPSCAKGHGQAILNF